MPSPAWEDLDDFLREDDFAFPAVINLQGGGQVSLSVIFDDPSVETRLGGDAYMKDDVRPTALCKEALVGAVRRGDTITVTFPDGARTLDILAGAHPDGTGMATLELAKQ